MPIFWRFKHQNGHLAFMKWTPGLVVSGSNRRLPHTKRKTKTQRQTASPVFEETLEYCLHESGTVGISLA